MAPFNSTPQSGPHHLPVFRRKKTPPKKKYRSMKSIMKTAKRVVLPGGNYEHLTCKTCGSGDKDEEMLLCDGCDNGFHMMCLRPVVVRVPIGSWYCHACRDHRPTPIKSTVLSFYHLHICVIKLYK